MALKDTYFTISEAAKEVGVTRQTISRWITNRQIHVEKVGRETLIKKKELARQMADQSVMQAATQIVNDIIVRIREKYGYTEEDIVEFRDFDQRNTFLFSVTKKDGSRETVRFNIGKAEPLHSKDKTFMLFGIKVPIEKMERRKASKE